MRSVDVYLLDWTKYSSSIFTVGNRTTCYHILRCKMFLQGIWHSKYRSILKNNEYFKPTFKIFSANYAFYNIEFRSICQGKTTLTTIKGVHILTMPITSMSHQIQLLYDNFRIFKYTQEQHKTLYRNLLDIRGNNTDIYFKSSKSIFTFITTERRIGISHSHIPDNWKYCSWMNSKISFHLVH